MKNELNFEKLLLTFCQKGYVISFEGDSGYIRITANPQVIGLGASVKILKSDSYEQALEDLKRRLL